MNSTEDKTLSPVQPWLCVFTKPRQEAYAETHLQRQGIEVFLPRIREKRLRREKLSWFTGPMFPRYIFIRPQDDQVISRVRSTLGVGSLVAFGDRPAIVPEEVVAAIQERCQEGVVTVEAPEIQPGDAVQIIGGPYEGMKAIFDKKTSQAERVVILLEIMASVARLKIDRHYLTPLPKEA